MKRKLIATLLVLGLMLTFVPMTIFSTSADTWDANGDADSQCYVTTRADLLAFITAVKNGNTFAGKTINIMADIDFGDEVADPSVGGGSANWPIKNGVNTTAIFSGMIDGHGHTIQGINIAAGTSDNKGLFGNELKPVAGQTVGVKNLTIKNCSVRGQQGTGGLFGQIPAADGIVLLDNLDLDIDVYGTNQYTGGMFGQSRGYDVTVSNCIFRGTVSSAKGTVGGLFGFQLDKKLTIANTVVSGQITGAKDQVTVGGFIAHVRENGAGNGSDTQIIGCVFDGVVTTNAANVHAGGFVGRVGATGSGSVTTRPGNLTIQDSAVYGEVNSIYANSTSHIGGLVGATNGSCKSTVTIDRIVLAGRMDQPDNVSANSGWFVSMTIAAVSSTGTATVNNIVGQMSGDMMSKGYNKETGKAGVYISTVPFVSSTGAAFNKGTTFLTGWSGLIPDGYSEAKFYYGNGTGDLGLDLSDTFVPTTSTKPLPMGVVRFYAEQTEGVSAGAATYAYGYQNTADATSIRMIGLLKATGGAAAYENVGLEIVAIRANGTAVKYVNNANEAATNTVYTAILDGDVTKTAAELDENYNFIFTVAITGIQADGGLVTFVVRSFHEVDGVRTYDDTRVINYDPAVEAVA